MPVHIDVGLEFARLKDFQRRTADHAFRQLFEPGGSGRFLVADEVGLGKTLVARGIVAKTIDHLQRSGVNRIDIIYVCTNSAIARQNINRLNVLGKNGVALASRLTLLPTLVQDLACQPVNFISFTPSTTFDLRSKGGRATERVLIYHMLREQPGLDTKGLLNILQGLVGRRSWKERVKYFDSEIDLSLKRDFCSSLQNDAAFYEKLCGACLQARDNRENLDAETSQLHKELTGELRRRLAHTSLGALEPDLVILDEFQRFKDLLDVDSEDEAASLAQTLFTYPGVKVLLLSATPYKMLTLDDDEEDDHYPDFMKTLSFLFADNTEKLVRIQAAMHEYRRALFSISDESRGSAGKVKEELASRLCEVMCRSERVGMTSRLDAMVSGCTVNVPIRASDLAHAAAMDKAARSVGARDTVEFWKSSPYLFNFLREYDVRRKIEGAQENPSVQLVEAINQPSGHRLTRRQLEAYESLDPANARMRYLFEQTLDRGMWRMLWMPPSLPYTQPVGAHAEVGDISKALLFSMWNVVPDAVAAVVSYEAERRMVEGQNFGSGRSELHDRIKPLLKFTREADGRLGGMPALALLQPSPTLAALADPLRIVVEVGGGATVSHHRVLEVVQLKVAELLKDLPEDEAGVPDQRWYWAAAALLDARNYPGFVEWCAKSDGWLGSMSGEDEEAGLGFASHLEHLREVMKQRVPLGKKPEDLAKVVAEFALGSPGVVALRALHRVAAKLPLDDESLLSAASILAEGMRSLFNNPETIALLRGEERGESYWRLVVQHCVEGNLQAVIDEQVHMLVEALGLAGGAAEDRVLGIAEELRESLSLRTAQLRVDEMRVLKNGSIKIEPFNTRCRFALRFGDFKDEEGNAVGRADLVRKAFNSPFRPFVLASTSIGQEGLDFHMWCHAVVHWNLPANPVDLEQREGRVNRYKGYAVRKNVAKRFGLKALADGWDGSDPWNHLFAKAAESRAAGSSELIPYWLFEVEGGATIERRIPLLPYSKEVEQLRRLKKSLALYRLVFGQPRQEDLLTHLEGRMTEEEAKKATLEWMISLDPR